MRVNPSAYSAWLPCIERIDMHAQAEILGVARGGPKVGALESPASAVQ